MLQSMLHQNESPLQDDPMVAVLFYCGKPASHDTEVFIWLQLDTCLVQSRFLFFFSFFGDIQISKALAADDVELVFMLHMSQTLHFC